MRVVGAAEIDAVLDYPALVAALGAAFAGGMTAPPRHHHTIPRAGADATLLLMPAWQERQGGFAGVKIVSVFPDNATRGKPSVIGLYLLLDGDSGEPLAALDGVALTAWRTAAASALAASLLARADARRLAMVGAGAIAARLDRRPRSRPPDFRGRDLEPHAGDGPPVSPPRSTVPACRCAATDDLAAAVGSADIVSAATMAHEPLIRGAWLKPGTHLDLVGAYNPDMREADDDAVRAARILSTRGPGRSSRPATSSSRSPPASSPSATWPATSSTSPAEPFPAAAPTTRSPSSSRSAARSRILPPRSSSGGAWLAPADLEER